MKEPLLLDDHAIRKRYNRRRFRDLRKLHALIDCRPDYLEECWQWLYHGINSQATYKDVGNAFPATMAKEEVEN